MKITPLDGYPRYNIDSVLPDTVVMLAEIEWGNEEPVPYVGQKFLKQNVVWTIQEMNPHFTPVRIRAWAYREEK